MGCDGPGVPKGGIVIHVAVCHACQRAFVTTEKFVLLPRHEYPTTGWACTGSGVVATWQTFRAVEMMKERDAATARADEVEEVCRLAQEDRIALLAAEASFANAERRLAEVERERDAARNGAAELRAELTRPCEDTGEDCCSAVRVLQRERDAAIARAEAAGKEWK